MKDIDFDELDRAVNSLMSGVPKTEPVKEEELKTVSLAVAETDSEPKPQAEPAATLAPSPSSLPASDDIPPRPTEDVHVDSIRTVAPAARRGRFMDMVRPVAEPRSVSPSRTASRLGATIQPTTGFSQPATIDGISPPAKPASTETSGSDQNDWPDPLASVDFNATTEAVEVKQQNSEVRSMPLASPFLPDTKVEKRPLGRPSTDDEPSEPSRAPVLGALVETETRPESNGDKAVPQQPLPVELGQEVMAIESDTTSFMDRSEEDVVPEKKPEPTQPEAAPQTPAAIRPIATSIPQQYKVQPSSTEPTTGAIYDVAAYHQPLNHPAKKKPGWLWVIVILLILLLGAASGAAVYYYGLV